MNEKIIYKINLILIVGSALILMILVGYSRPLLISPQNELVTTNNSILFSFEKADFILIDDNSDFTSPEKIYVKDNLIINLRPGTYYWKIGGISESETRELTINSEVNLKLKEAGEKYEVVNSGNTRLNVEIYDNGFYTGNIILGVDEGANVSGTKFLGEQNE